MEDKFSILLHVLSHAEKKDFSGYSKFDALNSPMLRKISFGNRWLRLLYTQLVKEMPFHVRPLLRVETSRNPKGIALFSRAYFSVYQKTRNPIFLEKAEKLLQWLLANSSPTMSHFCWGYNFIWQNTIFLQHEFEPNAVVTVFVGEALLHAYRVTHNEKYLEAGESVAEFFLQNLPILHQDGDELALAYVLRKVDAVVLNNQVLIGAYLIKLWRHTGHDVLRKKATALLNYTVRRATAYHAWYYTEPKGKSPIVHDNYHTGGILDGLLEYYEETGDGRYLETYWNGLEYYRENLFEENGAPRWMNNRRYPADIHGAAQGIITFKKAARHDNHFLEQSQKIANWTIGHLYRKAEGDFVYRRGRWLLWDYSLMRWCNAWMSRALAELTCEEGAGGGI